MVEIKVKSAEVAKFESATVKTFEKMKKMQWALEKPMRIEKLVETLYPTCSKAIDYSISRGSDLTRATFMVSNDDRDEVLEAIDIIRTCLIEAGYKVDEFSEYSKSWQTRSGKFGYLFISWDK